MKKERKGKEKMNKITLSNGVQMPQLGFGVYQIEDLDLCQAAVEHALKTGYRLIDTAAAYFNEEAVGKAIQASDVPRQDIFLVSKVWIQDYGYEATKAAFNRSLEKLQTDYLDLYLIHQAYNDYYGAWRAMEELYEAGKVKAIGVCNFNSRQLVDLISYNQIKPHVVQVEFNPLFQQEGFRQVLNDYDIQLMAWGPFAEGQGNLFNHEVLKAIGDQYDKTPAQVMLRWNLDQGSVTIPKSVHKERIEENFAIGDFTLSAEDQDKIKALDQGKSIVIDFDDPETVKALSQFKIHD
ncbi:aldo/keto reductase [Aerococcus mictus]|nr:aldo/keto reductase [Aerococcus mictus]PKY82351.1 aldo/keto reductase [Aerococcus mictus]PMB93358.1 aldo/keto reductase [Aerococcus mictus]RAV62530.1 aldo/keto reductase [Aerococcus mictus]RAV70641.1 aldo/keto reductase [Aerococcus mictus]